jgi:hypothetical protein
MFSKKCNFNLKEKQHKNLQIEKIQKQKGERTNTHSPDYALKIMT